VPPPVALLSERLAKISHQALVHLRAYLQLAARLRQSQLRRVAGQLALRRGAGLLNAGRGAVIEEQALPEALERGWLRAAALDVFVREPLPPDSPLWNDPRVIVSPHISGLTTTAGAVAGFLECAEALARGEMPKWVVDRTRGY